MSAKVVATDGEIVAKFFENDTIGFYLQADELEYIITVPMKPYLARDRAIAAKGNGHQFGRERKLLNKLIEIYAAEYPEIEEIA